MSERISPAPLSLIVAVDQDGGFGKDGKIPWNLPEDLAHFKDVTNGGVCIMGRKTYLDMLNMIQSRATAKKSKKRSKKKPKIKEILPGRTSFVVTRDVNFDAPGATVVSGIREAVQTLDVSDSREVFVIGGRQMFIEALPWATTIHMTIIKGEPYNCDVFFPVDYLTEHFKLIDGSETEQMYFTKYSRVL